jgi:hypothetical protein
VSLWWAQNLVNVPGVESFVLLLPDVQREERVLGGL